MTTKRQAEICVEHNLSDDEIRHMTHTHRELVDIVRAWGRGEYVEIFNRSKWEPLSSDGQYSFGHPEEFRRVSPRIHVKAILPDGTEREASFPEPVREALKPGERYFLSSGDHNSPVRFLTWDGDWQCRKRLQEGRVFRTRGQAKERDEAMIWISSGEA